MIFTLTLRWNGTKLTKFIVIFDDFGNFFWVTYNIYTQIKYTLIYFGLSTLICISQPVVVWKDKLPINFFRSLTNHYQNPNFQHVCCFLFIQNSVVKIWTNDFLTSSKYFQSTKFHHAFFICALLIRFHFLTPEVAVYFF